jgi:hypothetical protein
MLSAMRVMVFIGSLVLANSALAAKSCDFKFFSRKMGRTYQVCQTTENLDDCGKWSRGKNDNSWTYPVGKDQGGIHMRGGSCSVAGMIGSCRVPTGTIFFYEGTPKEIAKGCGWMGGVYSPGPLANALGDVAR